jgi:hypothetical protein
VHSWIEVANKAALGDRGKSFSPLKDGLRLLGLVEQPSELL